MLEGLLGRIEGGVVGAGHGWGGIAVRGQEFGGL